MKKYEKHHEAAKKAHEHMKMAEHHHKEAKKEMAKVAKVQKMVKSDSEGQRNLKKEVKKGMK